MVPIVEVHPETLHITLECVSIAVHWHLSKPFLVQTKLNNSVLHKRQLPQCTTAARLSRPLSPKGYYQDFGGWEQSWRVPKPW